MVDLISGTGNDNPNGREGADSDILDGGAGSGRLNGGSGADTLIYRLSDNLIGAATTDIYTGGSAIDTLRIALTASQWANYNVQAQLASYLQFLSTVSVHPQEEGADGSARDFFFAFGTTRLKVQMTEKLDLYVDGTSIGDLSQPFVMGEQTTGNLVETADETPSGSAAMAAFGTLNFSDLNWADTHYATVAPMAGATGTMTASVTNAATGDGQGQVTWQYTPDDAASEYLAAGQTKVETFIVTITDSSGKSATRSVTITVTGTNDEPVISAADDSAAVAEDASTPNLTDSGKITFDDLDLIDANSTSATAEGSNTLGGQRTAKVDPLDLATGAGSGTVNWNYSVANSATQHLVVGQAVTEAFTNKIADSRGDAVSQLITVTATNDVPVANAAVAALDEDASISGSVSASDADASGTATLRYALVDPAPAGLSFNPNGSYSFDASSYGYLNVGEPLELVVAFTATDENGATSTSAKLVITITGTNDVPVASAAVAALDEDTSISGSVNASDADAGETATLRYALVDPAPAGLSFNPNGSYSFDASSYGYLNVGEPLELVVAFTATDENGATSTSAKLVITITGTNEVPVANAAVAALDEDASISGSVSASDADASGTATLRYALVDPAPAGLSFNPNGSYSFDASSYGYLNVGEPLELVVAFTATDQNGATSTSANLVITITGTNDVPDIQLMTTDSASASLTETNAGLSTFGTLAVADADLSDTVGLSVTSIVASEATADLGLTNAQLLAMPSIDDQTVTITINGSTEGPVAAPPVDNSVDPNDFDSAGPGAAATLVVPDTPAINGGNIIVGTTENGTVDANAGNDFVDGYSGDDTLAGGSGTDSIYGGAGNDTVDGGQATGTIYASSGDDFIQAGSEIDTIYSGSGNDIIQGDAASDVIVDGADILTGNAGDDIFGFLDTPDTGDTITGFTSGDKIDLSNIDADPSTGNDTFAFAGNTSTLAAHAVNGFFNDNGTAVDTADDFTVIQLDSDGNVGTAEMEIHLISTISLVAADFLF